MHRLILVSILITHKFYTDPFYKNSDIARIGGVHLQEINFLEEEFLDIIDFNLIVESKEYDQYLASLRAFFSEQLQPETVNIIEENQSWFERPPTDPSQQVSSSSNSLARQPAAIGMQEYGNPEMA